MARILITLQAFMYRKWFIFILCYKAAAPVGIIQHSQVWAVQVWFHPGWDGDALSPQPGPVPMQGALGSALAGLVPADFSPNRGSK